MMDGYGDRTLGNAVDMSAPFPSWEQPADAQDGFDQFMAMLPNLTAPATDSSRGALEPVKEESSVQTSAPAIEHMSSIERRLHKNKLAQKRFRDKQKVRSQELEVQFAATTAELQDLKSKQKTLEARNLLLEKLVQLSKQQQQPTSEVAANTDDLPNLSSLWGPDGPPGPFPVSVTTVPSLKLTIYKDKEQVIPVRQVSKLSLPDFAKLYSEYARQMGNCLMELQQNSSSLVLQQLQTWAVEVETLIVSVVLSSPGRMKEFTNSRMDDSTSCSEERPANFYTNLVKAIELSESQVEDLMYLRQLLYCKQGQMARERKALLHKMTSNNVEYMGHISDKLSELTQWSEQLRKNGSEEYRVVVEFCSAYYSGILSTKQSATAMVYAYPCWPKHETMLEELATERGKPSVQSLLEDTSVDDFQHAANWQEVVKYLTSITMETVHVHVPLLLK